MEQRNMQCFSPMMDLGIDPQDQGHAHPEPSFLLGSIPNVSHHNFPVMLPGSRNTPNAHHMQEHYENAIFSGAIQYNGLQHHLPCANVDIGVATSSNYYNPYMNPPTGSGIVPVQLNHGFSDQLPSSSNQEVIGIPTATDEYGRSNPFMGDARGSSKRKITEGIQSNYQYFNFSASSSSSTAPFNTMQFRSRVPAVDAAPYPLPQFGGTSTMEVEPQRSMMNGPGGFGVKPVLPHGHDHFGQGIYRSHPFQPVGTPWLDQRSSSSGDGGTSTWNRTPVLHYLHGSAINGGSFESRNQGAQGYIERNCNITSTSFLQPPIHHQSLQNSVSHMQGVMSHDIDLHPTYGLAVNSSSRTNIDMHPTYGLATNNSSHSGPSPQGGAVAAFSYSGPNPQNGHRMYRPRRVVLPESTPRNHNYPHLRYLPADEVAILEIPGFNEVGIFIDQHRDMRLDIDDMSYEELLALGERIGNVKTGLSEEAISCYLNTRTFVSSITCIGIGEAGNVDEKNDFCVICQADYKNKEKIGTLDCGHEYHANCLKKWLLVKNVCPICKSSALTIEKKGT